MNRFSLAVSLVLISIFVQPVHAKKPIARVYHVTRVKILESNNVTTRPGSVYDNITYFESFLSFPKPKFYYEFIDSGLGAAEPLYPMLQAGYQDGWNQLFPAFFSKKARHIDHYSSLPTSEGCWNDSGYLLRHISEFPKSMYVQERKDGYEMIVIRLDYYTRLKDGVECGRHKTNPIDSNFRPIDFIKKYAYAKSLSDFPTKELNRFEAKVAAIYHVDENFIFGKEMPYFNPETLNHNSLWFYPKGVPKDYNMSESANYIHSIDQAHANEFQLDRVVGEEIYTKMMAFLTGKPTPDFKSEYEPGRDVLDIRQVTSKNFYTHGVEYRGIKNAVADVFNSKNFKLIGVVIKPNEEVEDQFYSDLITVPQVRLIYQMMDPQNPSQPVEQLYYHLIYDGVDRLADFQTRKLQHEKFLENYKQIVLAKQAGLPEYPELLADLVQKTIQTQPLQMMAFSSSLTGIWVFGTLTRHQNPEHRLEPMWIKREGVDVGYYSSVYDMDLFRDAYRRAKKKSKQKQKLARHLKDLTVGTYRDPKRHDPHAIHFNRMTCAQCHQMSGRDAVHFSLNDGIDQRFQEPVRVTEFLYRDIQKQLLQLRAKPKSF